MKKRIQVTLIMCCFVACSILMSCSVSAEKGAEKMDPLQSQISLARDYFNEGKLHLCFGILLDLLKGEPDQNTLKSIASITGDIYHNKLFPEIKHLSQFFENGSSYQTGDFYVPLQAEPDDNVQLAYVEFYRDGDLIATTEEWPHTARWDIEEPGQHTFWALAYDAAGNSTESERITITVSE